MPSEDVVDKAIAIARTGPAEYEYLFTHITSAGWIEPLFERDFFKDPVPAIREGDTIRFPSWPESQYLARVADQDPKKVLEIALQIPETNNVRIHEDLAQAACKMPGPLAREWALHELPWVGAKPHLFMLLPEELGRLVQHLVETQEVDAALKLARTVLQVRMREGAESSEPWTRHPVSRLDPWNYGEFLRLRIPSLLKAAPKGTFDMLADTLEESLRIVSSAEEDEYGRFQDYTFVSRPAIEDHPQLSETDHPTDLDIALLLALRDASEAALSRGWVTLNEVTEWLEARAPITCWRIALHLLRLFADRAGARDLVVERLVSPKYFDVVALHHEYIELLRAQANGLSEGQLGALLALIDSSAEMRAAKKDEQEAPRSREIHTQQWLSELKEYLPEERLAELAALEAKHGERRLPDSHVGPMSVGWVVPNSPKTEEELEAMSPAELLRFGQDWQEAPDGFRHEAPSYEGLGKAVSAVVNKLPEKFAAVAESFASLPPAFAWGYLEGLSAAVERDEHIEWEHPLRLIRAISPHRDSEAGGLREPNWNWANSSALRLLERGLEKEERGLEVGHRELVWEALVGLTEHPEPTLEYEEQYGGSNMDPMTLSLNVIRGVAMNSVLKYALWLHRNGLLTRGFPDAPNIEELLSRHLDAEVDPSQAVRAVYGRWLPWLFLVDRGWTRANLQRILGRDSTLAFVAWKTYLTYVRPSNDMLPELFEYYTAAIEAMADHEDDDRSWVSTPNEALATHLMAYFLRGQLELEENGLVDRFFQAGSSKTLGYAMEWIGRGLRESPQEATERPILLWEWRWKSGAITSPELEAFGWWAASSSLEPVWMLTNLDRALSSAKKVDADWLVVERLAELAEHHGQLVVHCLRLMIEGAAEPWSINRWEKDIRTVLSSAIASHDPDVRQASEELTNLLGAKGYWSFSDLLPS